MKMVKRWGVMTLVALLVLGTMGAALAGEEVDAESAQVAPDQGSYPFTPKWAEELVAFVFYWGYGEDPTELPEEVDCVFAKSEPTPSIFILPEDGDLVEVPCEKIPLKKPNHGSMVSSFVHWLKDADFEDLKIQLPDLPKGQLVKQFAHDDFGKGFYVFELDDALEAADVDVEESDGHGPPAWVKDKKADKPAKGKNK